MVLPGNNGLDPMNNPFGNGQKKLEDAANKIFERVTRKENMRKIRKALVVADVVFVTAMATGAVPAPEKPMENQSAFSPQTVYSQLYSMGQTQINLAEELQTAARQAVEAHRAHASGNEFKSDGHDVSMITAAAVLNTDILLTRTDDLTNSNRVDELVMNKLESKFAHTSRADMRSIDDQLGGVKRITDINDLSIDNVIDTGKYNLQTLARVASNATGQYVGSYENEMGRADAFRVPVTDSYLVVTEADGEKTIKEYTSGEFSKLERNGLSETKGWEIAGDRVHNETLVVTSEPMNDFARVFEGNAVSWEESKAALKQYEAEKNLDVFRDNDPAFQNLTKNLGFEKNTAYEVQTKAFDNGVYQEVAVLDSGVRFSNEDFSGNKSVKFMTDRQFEEWKKDPALDTSIDKSFGDMSIERKDVTWNKDTLNIGASRMTVPLVQGFGDIIEGKKIDLDLSSGDNTAVNLVTAKYPYLEADRNSGVTINYLDVGTGKHVSKAMSPKDYAVFEVKNAEHFPQKYMGMIMPKAVRDDLAKDVKAKEVQMLRLPLLDLRAEEKTASKQGVNIEI